MIAALLVVAPFLPLALALAIVPQSSRRAVAILLPLAPLPALAVAVLAEPGLSLLLPNVLLGLHLGLDEERRLLLGMTALLWTAAGIYSRGYIRRDAEQHRYDAFFLTTMGGNIGLVVALDVPGFYLFFSLMTLSSYILVVFERSESAYRAGRAYILLSILGETALLLGFLSAVQAAESLSIAQIAPALAAEGARGTYLLLFLGFAIKAGQLPLHVWLPLAHPAAPTPASAVLSGAMIKAGLLGMILFLPLGEASLPSMGMLLTAIGLATAFYGVACGLPQANPKTVLAYSSLSQMGLLVAALGVAQEVPEAAGAILPAVLLYATHHGLSKAGLFFSVGVMQKAVRGHAVVLALAALGAVAVAGAPLTAGALAKLLLKEGVEAPGAATAGLLGSLLSWSAVATSLLMFRFLWTLAQAPGDAEQRGGTGWLLWGPFTAIVLLGQALPWVLVSLAPESIGLPGGAGAAALTGYALWESAWPPLLAMLLAAAGLLARRAGLVRLPRVPEGDWLALLPPLRDSVAFWARGYRRVQRATRRRPQLVESSVERLSGRLALLEEGLLRQQAGMLALVFLALVLAAVLLR